MSFFGKLFGEGDAITELDERESFIGILYAVIAADGNISDEEAQDFITAISRAKFISSITGNEWRNIMQKISRVAKKDGPEGLVQLASKNIPDAIKQGTFAYACELVFSDGYADESEQKILDLVKTGLNIDDSLAYKVAEVVMIKNKI